MQRQSNKLIIKNLSEIPIWNYIHTCETRSNKNDERIEDSCKEATLLSSSFRSCKHLQRFFTFDIWIDTPDSFAFERYRTGKSAGSVKGNSGASKGLEGWCVISWLMLFARYGYVIIFWIYSAGEICFRTMLRILKRN